MFIHEAVKKAIEVNGVIARKEIEEGIPVIRTVIKPTNSYAACIIIDKAGYPGKKHDRCKNWNPTTDDLMADDWQMVAK